MFWKFDLNTTSHVDKLLDKEDVSLQELMEEDDLLQECKAQNRRLLGFLCQPQCMELLVQLITQNPPADMEEKVRFKYPNIACELLTCDAPQINDKLGGDESLLNTLYDFLRQEPPLNPLLASFFSKTIGNLIARKTEQVIGFLRAKDQFLGLVLEHIGTSAMMDLLLRLISCVEPAPLRQEVLCWLNEEKLIQRLVDLIHARQDEDRQTNASQTLCDLIRLSRDQGNPMHETLAPDPLLSALESQQCVEQILQNMFDGEHSESCMVSGTQILLTLLENRRPSVDPLLDSLPQGYERPHTVSSSILQGIEPRLKDFHQLLLHPPKESLQETRFTAPHVQEPLQETRFTASHVQEPLQETRFTAPHVQELLQEMHFPSPHVQEPWQETRFTAPHVQDPLQEMHFTAPHVQEPLQETRFQSPHVQEPRQEMRFTAPHVQEPLQEMRFQSPHVQEPRHETRFPRTRTPARDAFPSSPRTGTPAGDAFCRGSLVHFAPRRD